MGGGHLSNKSIKTIEKHVISQSLPRRWAEGPVSSQKKRRSEYAVIHMTQDTKNKTILWPCISLLLIKQ